MLVVLISKRDSCASIAVYVHARTGLTLLRLSHSGSTRHFRARDCHSSVPALIFDCCFGCMFLQIHSDGGKYLGRALKRNDSLTELNVRLNRLDDEVCVRLRM